MTLIGRSNFLMVIMALCVLFFLNDLAYAEVIKLRYSHYMSTGTPQVKIAEEWCREVEKRTNGRVKVTLYVGGTLLSVADTYDGIEKGIADIGRFMFAYSRGRFPLSEVLDLPLGVPSGYVATKMINAFYKQFMPKELDDVKVLYLEGHGPGIINTKKPVTKLEDLQGIKIRSSGLSGKLISALGAVPVALPITDAYDALSKGVCDGIANDIGSVYVRRIGEVVKYHVKDFSTSYTSAMGTIMNKDKWNSLPPDIKKIIDEINEEWVEKAANMWIAFDGDAVAALKKAGNTFIDLPKTEEARWAERAKPVLAELAKNTDEKNLPGTEGLKFCQDFLVKQSQSRPNW